MTRSERGKGRSDLRAGGVGVFISKKTHISKGKNPTRKEIRNYAPSGVDKQTRRDLGKSTRDPLTKA